MRRSVWIAIITALCAAAVAGPAAGPAAAKNFRITDVSIDALVMPNGNVRVHESRTLDFSGTFHFVYWDYGTKGSDGLKVMGASGPTSTSGSAPYQRTGAGSGVVPLTPGTYSVTDQAAGVRVQLNFALTDTSATFGVNYVALGAAKRYSDTSELYWQFVGADTGVPSDHVKITVHLPAYVTKDQVRAWTHGPLWGTVRIERSPLTTQPGVSVVSEVSPLPAYTFVEPRILFPAAALSAATPISSPRLNAVLAEEKALADKANKDRLMARVRVILWSLLGVGVPLLAIVLVVVLYLKYGREPKAQFQAQYLRDIPSPPLPPALVGFIWRMGDVTKDDATATLLDLVNRGVIDIERVQVQESHLFVKDEAISYRLTLHEERLDGLQPFEHQLVTFLFIEIAGGWSFVLSELKDFAKAKRTQFAAGYKAWTTAVEQEGEHRGYLDAKADQMAFFGAALGFVAAVAAGAAAVLGRYGWFVIGVPVSVFLIYRARAIKRRSAEAAELHAQYSALKRYMKDFGRLDEKPPDAVVLWESFLVYAVVFGMADEVVKAMQVKVPEVVQDPAFGRMYWLMFPMAPGGGGGSPFSEMSQSFTQAVSVATSAQSSGAGGGGGFSGGGGGGGGGGGFGAG